MLRVCTGTILSVLEERDGVQSLEVVLHRSGLRSRAFHYFGGEDACRPGDVVLLNTTAVDLSLGSGGYDFVIARLHPDVERDLRPAAWGHVVKMRYTPLQMAVDCVEDPKSPWHSLFADESLSLEGTPVLIGELHSLLPMLALALHRLEPSLRVAYVMPDSAALPAAWSRHLHHCRKSGLVCTSVTAGHAWGGECEAVNLHTALLAASHVARADVIICLPGPGVVGTGTPLGFSGLQLAEAIHAAFLLGGIPIAVPRLSFSDERERHRGISHHTRTLMGRFVLCPALVPVPRFGDGRDALIDRQLREARLADRHHLLFAPAEDPSMLSMLAQAYPEPLTTMGRLPQEDDAPFQTACLAARVACYCRNWLNSGGPVLPPDPRGLTALARSWDCRPSGEA